MSAAIAAVERLFAAWEALDPQAVAACFTADGVWHNMPFAPIEGQAAIAAVVASFLGDTKECRFEVRHIAEIAPGTVVTERVDVFASEGKDPLRLPVMGIFEIEDGMISKWRDYFDSKPFS
jgi:limonene-1,2-epoxide hydrolase